MAEPSKKTTSGKDRLAAVIEKQKEKALEMINLVAKHQGDLMHMEDPTLSENDVVNLEDEFKAGLINKMRNDPAEFKYIIEMYIEDLKEGKVKDKEEPSKKRLKEFGAIGVDDELLKSAGMRVASGIRRGAEGISKKELGFYKKIFKKKDDAASPESGSSDSYAGKALEKISSFAELLKDKKQEDGETPSLDLKQFREDKEYRDEMLDYLKDIARSNKELSKDQKELLEQVKKEKSLQKFIEGTRERMTPGGQILYDITKAASKAVGNLGKNLFGKKKDEAAAKKVDGETSDITDLGRGEGKSEEDLKKLEGESGGTPWENAIDTSDATTGIAPIPVPTATTAAKVEPIKQNMATYIMAAPPREPSKQLEIDFTDENNPPPTEQIQIQNSTNVNEFAETTKLAETKLDNKREDENLETLKHIDENIEKLVELSGETSATSSPSTIIPPIVKPGAPKPGTTAARGTFMNKAARVARGSAPIAALAGGYEMYSGISETNKALEAGEISKEEARVKKTGAIGSGIGTMGGAMAGAAIGSVIPGVGTVVGGLVGGAIGAWGGSKVGQSAGEAVGTSLNATSKELENIPVNEEQAKKDIARGVYNANAMRYKAQQIGIERKTATETVATGTSVTEPIPTETPAAITGAEQIKKDTTAQLETEATKEAAKQQQSASQLVNNVTDAKTTNSPVTIMGGSSGPHFKQNPRNPDNSLKSWMNTRVAYV